MLTCTVVCSIALYCTVCSICSICSVVSHYSCISHYSLTSLNVLLLHVCHRHENVGDRNDKIYMLSTEMTGEREQDRERKILEAAGGCTSLSNN